MPKANIIEIYSLNFTCYSVYVGKSPCVTKRGKIFLNVTGRLKLTKRHIYIVIYNVYFCFQPFVTIYSGNLSPCVCYLRLTNILKTILSWIYNSQRRKKKRIINMEKCPTENIHENNDSIFLSQNTTDWVWQGLSRLPRQALNSSSSCLWLLTAGIASVQPAPR